MFDTPLSTWSVGSN